MPNYEDSAIAPIPRGKHLLVPSSAGPFELEALKGRRRGRAARKIGTGPQPHSGVVHEAQYRENEAGMTH
ncbi:hypothetical protein MHYP_G00115870 [Metynnis hypsauchen]